MPVTVPTQRYSNITHLVAAVLTTAAAFLLTPAGQALVKQYPKLSILSGLIAMLGSLYKDPSAV